MADRTEPIRGSHRLLHRAQPDPRGGRCAAPRAGAEERERTEATAWVPAADIFARDRDLVIRVEVAGVAPEDVAITFSGGVLTVSGVRRTELGSASTDSFYIRERPYGAFRRSLTLPPAPTTIRSPARSATGWSRSPCGTAAPRAEPQRIALKNASKAPDRRGGGG